VLPSVKTVEDATYQPLSRPIFIYVNAKSAEKPEVREFVEFYMKNGPELVKEVKFFALPSQAYATNLEHLSKKKIGTVFGGKPEVGLKIEEVLKREASL
jgi:phosphate transport system substrate-binding protein